MPAIGDRRPSEAQHGSPMERAQAFFLERRKRGDRVGAVAVPAVEAAAGALDSSGKPLAQRVRESKPWRRLLHAVNNRTKDGVPECPPKEDSELRKLTALQATIEVAQAHLGQRPSTPPAAPLIAPRQRERRLSVDGSRMTQKQDPPPRAHWEAIQQRRKAIEEFEAAPSQAIKRRHSIVGLAAAPRGQQELTRRGSLDGVRLATNPQDRPEDLLTDLSYALKLFETSISALNQTQIGLRAKNLDVLIEKASHRNLDLDLWQAKELLKRPENGQGHTLFQRVLKECSSRSVSALLTRPNKELYSERTASFERACTGLIKVLEDIEQELPAGLCTRMWVTADLATLRGKDQDRIRGLFNDFSRRDGYKTELNRYERVKNSMFGPDGVELRAIVESEHRRERALGDLGSLFHQLCSLEVRPDTPEAILKGILERGDKEQCLNRGLSIALENGQWEWIRSIIHTGLIPFWTQLIMNIRLFFHNIFG